MPGLYGGYAEKGLAGIFKKPEPQEEKKTKFDDVDIDELLKKKFDKNEAIREFNIVEAEKVINEEFARLREDNNGKDGPRDKEAMKKILKMAEIICKEDGLSTDGATMEAIAIFTEGNVRKSRTVKEEN